MVNEINETQNKKIITVEKAIEMEKQGKCLILAPDDCCGIDTLSKNKDNLDKLYHKGYEDAGAVKEFVG